MPLATITSKGQVTIPKKVRDQLHLKPGDTIDFEIDSHNTIRITAKKRHHSELAGMFKHKAKKIYSVEEMDEGIAEYLRRKYSKK